MIDFNFEHFFQNTSDVDFSKHQNKLDFENKPSLAFMQKNYLPLYTNSTLNELSLSPDVKQFFKPTIEEKQEIIEDFLMWAHEKELSADNSGTMIMYIRELKSRC